MKLISFRTLRSLCLDFVIFLIPCVLIFFAFPFLLSLFMPFIIGFLLFLLTSPLNRFLIKRSLPRSLAAFLSLFIISCVVVFALRAVSTKIFVELRSLVKEAPDFSKETLGFVSNRVSSLMRTFSPSGNSVASELFSSFSDAISQTFSQLFSKMSTFIFNMAKNLPSLLIQIIASFFTAYFLLKEGELFFSFFRSFFGEKVCEKILRAKTLFLNVFLKYVKAQLIIALIIFCILFLGMLLLKIKYAFLLAFLTALVDVVPIFGTGTVLIPLSIYNFLSRNSTLAWGIVVLYGITVLTRQLLEPKIVGEKLGIHPLVTIFSIYLGLKLLGVLGLLFGPFTAILIKTLFFADKGVAIQKG